MARWDLCSSNLVEEIGEVICLLSVLSFGVVDRGIVEGAKQCLAELKRQVEVSKR